MIIDPRHSMVLLACALYVGAGPATAQSNLAAEGRLLFQEEIGCADCHGTRAEGDAGPDIRGRSVADIHAAKADVEDMGFLEVTDNQIDAIAAYLTYLNVPSDDKVAQGQYLFVEQIGCADCHGQNARGDAGPDIRDRTVADIHRAKADVEDMGFLEVTDEQIDAIAAFLGSL